MVSLHTRIHTKYKPLKIQSIGVRVRAQWVRSVAALPTCVAEYAAVYSLTFLFIPVALCRNLIPGAFLHSFYCRGMTGHFGALSLLHFSFQMHDTEACLVFLLRSCRHYAEQVLSYSTPLWLPTSQTCGPWPASEPCPCHSGPCVSSWPFFLIMASLQVLLVLLLLSFSSFLLSLDWDWKLCFTVFFPALLLTNQRRWKTIFTYHWAGRCSKYHDSAQVWSETWSLGTAISMWLHRSQKPSLNSRRVYFGGGGGVAYLEIQSDHVLESGFVWWKVGSCLFYFDKFMNETSIGNKEKTVCVHLGDVQVGCLDCARRKWGTGYPTYRGWQSLLGPQETRSKSGSKWQKTNAGHKWVHVLWPIVQEFFTKYMHISKLLLSRAHNETKYDPLTPVPLAAGLFGHFSIISSWYLTAVYGALFFSKR